MELSLFASGVIMDGGKPTQRSGVAAVLTATEGGVVKYREMSQYLDEMTGTQAELQAAFLALMAVRSRLRDRPVILSVGTYPAKMLERVGDGWAANARTNELLVRRLRDLAFKFPKLNVVSRRSVEFTRAGDLAREAATNRVPFDTGTLNRTGV